ncbi:putative ATP-citrate synthase [Diplonema papillatum]|nr:putative ATP-citrate synthase [Diplonema papillatum]|eukprot:gene22086-33869_t
MSAKAIREYDGKRLLSEFLDTRGADWTARQVLITPESDLEALPHAHPWLTSNKLVAKPDQLIKRRGKGGLILLNADWEKAKAWIKERMQKEVEADNVVAQLDHFLVEPFLPHEQKEEVYICIQSNREGDEFLFHHEGGVDVGDVDAKAKRYQNPVGAIPTEEELTEALLGSVPEESQEVVAKFLVHLFQLFSSYNFVYLEINPLVLKDGKCYPLDMAAKIDEAAAFECDKLWGNLEFPAPFGRPPCPEEAFVKALDEKTGASLKLTILNPEGRVWLMVAGGGASVVYSDTVTDLGYAADLANYGEYSGAPNEVMTYQYAKTVLKLMTNKPDAEGKDKVLIIGGGIANFTDVAATFKGIIRALTEFKEKLLLVKAKIWVRRAGPNWQEALKLMRATAQTLDLPINVYGPETHMTAVVSYALGLSEPPVEGAPEGRIGYAPSAQVPCNSMFNSSTRAFVYGMQLQAVQQMLDFDFLCKREKPSVAGIVFPFSGDHSQRVYWGRKEIMLPCYTKIESVLKFHPEVTVMVNFASFRSAFSSTMEALQFSGQLKTIAIIAEGVPEKQTRLLIQEAKKRCVSLIGPATVGGLQPGAFRVGNTGGAIENIVACKLYRPGCVGYVSKSGGMSNELNNIISRNADGVAEGLAIGGDRYPGTRFLDVLLRYEANPNIKMVVLLGEVGGTDEYDVCQAIKDKKLTKPLVAWCVGTCASCFKTEVQFGHAGALARTNLETAAAKNAAMAAAGCRVPSSFDTFGGLINTVFLELLEKGIVKPGKEPEPPQVPMDYAWAKKLGLIRKPAAFISSIVDERGEELTYAGIPISKVFSDNLGIGGVVSLLWFRRRLPDYACKFIEMILMVTADHGPAVSGAHNTIVTARAGKDLVSSLCSGLLTIGPRFGGALDDAALMFSNAFDSGMSPERFVSTMRKENKLIMGIGHKVKSIHNPDMRVTLVKDFARQNFPKTDILDFALEVEQVTTKKKSNLILNVDGAIACAFVDLLRSCAAFTRAEADESIANGVLNGLFVLGRSTGFIGHFLDQKRLKQGLYRHPVDDINYLETEDLTTLAMVAPPGSG